MIRNEIRKGDIIKTSLSDNTVILDVVDKKAILFSGNQFVIASGISFNEKSDKFEWDNGIYTYDFSEISNMQNNNFDNMKKTLSFLAEYNHKDFVKSVISLETGIENEEILNDVYDNYMNDKIIGLVDEKFYDYVDKDDIEKKVKEDKVFEL